MNNRLLPSKWTIHSPHCYTENNYIKYLFHQQLPHYHRPLFLLHCSIFTPILLPSLSPPIHVLQFWLAYSFKSTKMLSLNDKLENATHIIDAESLCPEQPFTVAFWRTLYLTEKLNADENCDDFCAFLPCLKIPEVPRELLLHSIMTFNR